MSTSQVEIESLLRVISSVDQLVADSEDCTDPDCQEWPLEIARELHEPLRALADHYRSADGDVPSLRFALGKLEERLRGQA